MTLIWRPGYITTFADPDVQSYLTRVEEADNQRLEYPVAVAIDEFIRGCKADGIWSAIKASCIMAGARTLNGALIPLVGPAPTNFNFVAGDYNRKTGLVGNGGSGSTKYLNTNRTGNADPLDSFHQAVWRTESETRTGNRCLMGNVDNNVDQLFTTSTARFFRNRVAGAAGSTINDTTSDAGLFAHSRSSASSYVGRYAGTDYNFSGSTVANNSTHLVYRRSGDYADARLAFYSIGENLDLALLDARITTLINRFAVVIP
jgi:hypothetical protein